MTAGSGELDAYLATSFGKAFITTDPEITFFPTGLANVDRALGGGIPRGRVIEVYGDPSSGKSTLALHMARRITQQGLYVLYFDLETTLAGPYLRAYGLDPALFKLVQPIEQPITAEQVFKHIEALSSLLREDLGMVVIDSLPFLVPEAEAEAHEEGRAATYSPLASFLAKELRHVVAPLARAGTTLFCVNQQSQVIGSRYPMKDTPGGNRFKYTCSQRIHISRTSRPDFDTSERVTVEIRTEKNKVGDPFRRAQFDIIFGQGPDEASALLQECLGQKLLLQKGSWIAIAPELMEQLLPFGIDKPNLAQGAENASRALAAQPELFEFLYQLATQPQAEHPVASSDS